MQSWYKITATWNISTAQHSGKCHHAILLLKLYLFAFPVLAHIKASAVAKLFFLHKKLHLGPFLLNRHLISKQCPAIEGVESKWLNVRSRGHQMISHLRRNNYLTIILVNYLGKWWSHLDVLLSLSVCT